MTSLENIEIKLTAQQVGAAVIFLAIAVLGGFWAVLSLAMSGIDNDIDALRNDIRTAQVSDSEIRDKAHVIELDLQDDFAGLARQLAETVITLRNLDQTIGQLTLSIKEVDDRQRAFESFVVTRLGNRDFTSPSKIPTTWSADQDSFLERLYSGDDPLSSWAEAAFPSLTPEKQQ